MKNSFSNLNLSAQHYQQHLSHKVNRARALLRAFSVPEPEVFASSLAGFRMRAEFRIWHTGERCSYAMFAHGQKPSMASVELMHSYPLACDLINHTMPVLLALINATPYLRHKLFQVEFLATLSGELLITLIYHKKIDAEFLDCAQIIKIELQNQLKIARLEIIGRSRGVKLQVNRDYLLEKFTLNLPTACRELSYRQYEGSFSQPNAQICIAMLNWALAATRHLGADMLELYCGNGNFSLPLSFNFAKVLATEISKTSVKAAMHNIAANQIENVKIARLSSAEFVSAYHGEREFVRLKTAGIDLHDYDFSTVLIDPPRAGLDADTLALVSQFEHILYISCNMQSLAQNLDTLCKSHQVVKFALFDQFAHSEHIELGLLLTRI